MRGTGVTGSDRRQWNGEPLVLFVEGYSDLCFYAELMQSLGKHERCFIQNLGGKGRTNLEKQASLLLVPDKLEQMEAVGIILDADESAQAAFVLAQRSLRNVIGVEVPAQTVWITAGKTKFGVFIAEDPSSGTGEIETLAWLSWAGRAENAPLRECVSSYLQCAEGGGAANP